MCVCVCNVNESPLWSGAMEHHIVAMRDCDDDCFVCTVVTALSRAEVRLTHTRTHTHAYTRDYKANAQHMHGYTERRRYLRT